MNRLNAIRQFVEAAHFGQTDLQGVAYYHHLEAVANRLMPFNDESLVAVGYGHDYLEDVKGAEKGIEESPFNDLERSLMWALKAPRAPRGVDYTQFYLEAYIKGQIIAHGDPRILLVKISDNLHNSDPARSVGYTPRDAKRLVRYRASMDLCLKAYQDHPNPLPESGPFALLVSDVRQRFEDIDQRLKHWPTSEYSSEGPTF